MKFQRQVQKNISMHGIYSLFIFTVFILLLFFVVIFQKLSGTHGLSVSLPRAVNGEVVSGNGIVVTIMDDDSIYVCESDLSASKEEARKFSEEELNNFLKARGCKGCQVLIKSDKRAHVGTLVEVWDLFRRSGAIKVSIATNG